MTTESEVFLTRSEERLVTSTETFPIGRVRLEKFIITEEQTITVTVRREEVRLVAVDLSEDEPPADLSDRALPELILRCERPVVTLEVVPTERVRLALSRVTTDQIISDTISHEQIGLDRS